MSGPSPTQRALTPADVTGYLRSSFGAGLPAVECGPLSGGGFATVWWAHLADGRDVVLKVAPPTGVRLLRYERGLTAAEARYFRMVAEQAPGVPVPPVLHHGTDPVRGEWLVTGRLPGRSLAELTTAGIEVDRARADFGAALAAVHRITGDRYGYPDGRAGGSTWPAAFAALIGDLLADAADWGVHLPAAPERIRELVRRHDDALGQVRRPALVHFDGWDGNVLAAPGVDGASRMCGLVDGERCLFGDPLMDLVSPLLFRRTEDEPAHPFLRGYAGASADPLVLDGPARRRLALYRFHLHLLMTVEMPSRGITERAAPRRHAFLADLLRRDLADLAAG